MKNCYLFLKEKDIPYLLLYNKEDMLKEEQKEFFARGQ